MAGLIGEENPLLRDNQHLRHFQYRISP